MIISRDGVRLVHIDFDREEELEEVVRDFATDLFGSGIVLLPQVTITTGDGRATVPDAIVVDLEARSWFIVEVELARHGTWDHIAPQVSRQLAAAESAATRERVLQKTLDQIRAEAALQKLTQELGISELSVHGHVKSILDRPPIVAIPIDSIPQDLRDWATTLRNTVYIWEIHKFVDPESDRIFYSVPDEATPTLETVASRTGDLPRLRSGGNKTLAELLRLEPGLLGAPLTLEYGPRGGERRTFSGVLRQTGVEVDGTILSPSYAAVHCMRLAGSSRPTANGWTMWRLDDGRLLNDAHQDALSASEEAVPGDEPG